MRLADFITANIEPVLAEWETFARGIWPGPATDRATLRDHADKMLRATVADMGSSQSDRQQSEKSRGKGEGGAQAARVDRESAAHGVDRVESGFDLAHVIAEYRALRASVVRLWRASNPAVDPHDLDDLTRFNESIDQSLTEAVVAYTGHVGRDRAAAMEAQESLGRELRQLNQELLVSSVRQHELTEQAEAANRAKDTFLAVLSHEMRTPLSPVVMAISAIETDADLPDKFRDDVAMVRRNIDLEVKLIDDLLDLSRVTSGKLRLRLQPVRLHELVDHVLRSNVGETYGKRLRVRAELHAQNDRLTADPTRIQQVIWNLVRNAVKFTPEDGEVVVRTWNADGDARLLIEVRDTGMGIDPGFLPRVFDAFRQGETVATRQFGGMGLGLAVAKAVMEMHGGIITAASDGPDRGAVFTLALNTDSPAERVEAPSRSSAAAPGRRPSLRVLVVEDHADAARVLSRLLRDAGYEVGVAGSAADALRLAAGRPFDVMVSDIGLPDATGHELMRQVRDRHGIKGIALSGYGMEDDVLKSRDAGFAEHIVKPVNFTDLQAVIQRVTGAT
jgi:signal transduction histidine kinase/CheY-like chemotaxis protein